MSEFDKQTKPHCDIKSSVANVVHNISNTKKTKWITSELPRQV